MAIDTENKRRSVLGVWGFMRVLPNPTDSTINEGDRRHLWGFRISGDSGIGALLASSMMMMGLGR